MKSDDIDAKRERPIRDLFVTGYCRHFLVQYEYIGVSFQAGPFLISDDDLERWQAMGVNQHSIELTDGTNIDAFAKEWSSIDIEGGAKAQLVLSPELDRLPVKQRRAVPANETCGAIGIA